MNVVTTKPRSGSACGASPPRSRRRARSARCLERPLGLPGGRAGGQHVVADHHARRGRRRASRRSDRLGHAHRARQVGRPRGRVEPGLVADPAASRSSRSARTSCPAAAAGAAAPRVIVQVGSWPRARTVAGRDGTGTSTTAGRRRPRRRRPRATAAASRSASGPRRPCMARSLWPRTRARSHVGVLGGRPRARPGPAGVGRRPRRPRAARQRRPAAAAQQPAGPVAADAAPSRAAGRRRRPQPDRGGHRATPSIAARARAPLNRPRQRLWTSAQPA